MNIYSMFSIYTITLGERNPGKRVISGEFSRLTKCGFYAIIETSFTA